MVAIHQFLNGSHRNHPLVRQHGHPVTDGVERVEIMGDERFKLFNFDFLRTEIQDLLAVPVQVRRLIRLAETGKLQVRAVEDPKATRRLERLERQLKRLNHSILAGAGLLGGVLLYNAGNIEVAIGVWAVAGLIWLLGGRTEL